MATSGTFTFTMDIADIIEEAYERVDGELRTGYDYRTARRSLDLLLLEWQNKGTNLWTIKSASQTLTAGTAGYTLAGERLDVVEALLRTNAGTSTQSDTNMERISTSTYAKQTNKLLTGRPNKYWVEHSPTSITVNVWPVPDSAQTYTLFYYYMERIEDSGIPGSNTIDVPARYLPCLTAGLAYYLGLKTPAATQKLPILKQVYDEQWNLASDAAREKSSWHLIPGGYS